MSQGRATLGTTAGAWRAPQDLQLLSPIAGEPLQPHGAAFSGRAIRSTSSLCGATARFLREELSPAPTTSA